MLEFGSDKPDLRNPIRIADVTEHYAGSGFGLFARIAASGGIVRAIPAPGAGSQPRSFFDKLNDWAKAEGQGGLGYITYDADGPKGPIARNLEAGPGRGDPRRLRAEARRRRVLRWRQEGHGARNSPAPSAPAFATNSACWKRARSGSAG